VLAVESSVDVSGITGREITDFLRNPTDDAYRAWWPGTHLHLHLAARAPEPAGQDVDAVRPIRTRSNSGSVGPLSAKFATQGPTALPAAIPPEHIV
jgi:hypothetical protein